MLIRLGYSQRFGLPAPAAAIGFHRMEAPPIPGLRGTEDLLPDPKLSAATDVGRPGTLCSRIFAQGGGSCIDGSTLIASRDKPDEIDLTAKEQPVHDLLHGMLKSLPHSRYCEVYRVSAAGIHVLERLRSGFSPMQTVILYADRIMRFEYVPGRFARAALDVCADRTGVRRGFQLLENRFWRGLNADTRNATGYLRDFGVSAAPNPMNVGVRSEVYLNGRQWGMDARYNCRRRGRVWTPTNRAASDEVVATLPDTTAVARVTVLIDGLDGWVDFGTVGR